MSGQEAVSGRRAKGARMRIKIPSKMKLTWITTVSKSEARQKKIDEILKPDNNE